MSQQNIPSVKQKESAIRMVCLVTELNQLDGKVKVFCTLGQDVQDFVTPVRGGNKFHLPNGL